MSEYLGNLRYPACLIKQLLQHNLYNLKTRNLKIIPYNQENCELKVICYCCGSVYNNRIILLLAKKKKNQVNVLPAVPLDTFNVRRIA